MQYYPIPNTWRQTVSGQVLDSLLSPVATELHKGVFELPYGSYTATDPLPHPPPEQQLCLLWGKGVVWTPRATSTHFSLRVITTLVWFLVNLFANVFHQPICQMYTCTCRINTVEQEIFACRLFSRNSRFSANSRKFPAREYYHYTEEVFFLSRNSRHRDLAKFSCHEIFLFYSILPL